MRQDSFIPRDYVAAAGGKDTSTRARDVRRFYENIYNRGYMPPLEIQLATRDPSTGRTDVVQAKISDILDATIKMSRNKLTMNRAFPGCVLYVKDENFYLSTADTTTLVPDSTTSHYYDITDWLIDARLIMNKDNPIHTLVLRLDGSDGFLAGGGSYEGLAPWAEQDPDDPTFYNPEDLGTGGFLRPGVPIEMRFGYDNNVDALEGVFTGQVSTIDGEDVLIVECQSWGCELVSGVIHNRNMSEDPENAIIGGGWPPGSNSTSSGATTENIFRYFFLGGGEEFFFITNAKPLEQHLEHFGKYWSKEISGLDAIQLGKVDPALRLKINDRSMENLYLPFNGPSLSSTTQLFPAIKTDWVWFNIGNSLRFNPWGMTLWDVMKEMELRHPGFYTLPVPYKTMAGTEMTLFFGPPNAMYVWRGKTVSQMLTYRIAPYLPTTKVSKGGLVAGALLGSFIQVGSLVGGAGAALLGTATEQVKTSIGIPPSSNVRPFRRYHLLTSDHDIIANNIRVVGGDEAVNSVTVRWMEGSVEKDADGNVVGDAELTDVNADDNILPADIKNTILEHPNAFNQAGARTGGISQLIRHMKDYYDGELIVVGNESIKPYDVCILFDTYSGMIGPFEVKEVEHSISADGGFITSIRPALCVSAEEMGCHLLTTALEHYFYKMAVNTIYLNRSGSTAGEWSRGVLSFKEQHNLSLTTAFLLPPLLGPWLGFQILGEVSEWWEGKTAEYRSPVVVHPLVKNGLPYLNDALWGYRREEGGFWAITSQGWQKQSEGFLKALSNQLAARAIR
jgi:hypothetical protein